MATFILFCVDKPNSLELRMATRERHLAYIQSRMSEVRIAGPMFNDAGDMAGSMLIVDVADKAAAEAFTAADPYNQAGLFERVDVKPIKVTFGQI